MKYTSAQAAKLLKKLKTKEQELRNAEARSNSFTAAIEENVEDARPAYDYEATQKSLRELELSIRKLKHVMNVFNSTTRVPGFDMTIDEMLVYIPQLSFDREKYEKMAAKLPKERVEPRYGSQPGNFIEYKYANYDIEKAQRDLARVREEIDRAQLALDKVNTTVEMEIDL